MRRQLIGSQGGGLFYLLYASSSLSALTASAQRPTGHRSTKTCLAVHFFYPAPPLARQRIWGRPPDSESV